MISQSETALMHIAFSEDSIYTHIHVSLILFILSPPD